jgi:D-psicose/D-tagatose/L-ribulose 3-epimerase
MNISVSNIAWYQDPRKITNFFEFISSLNCNGVELAPSAIWSEPIDSSKQDRDNLKKEIKSNNLNFLGFHSLLYSKPELKLFENSFLRKETKNYLFDLINLCSDLEGKNLVYGSPKSRELCGKKYDDCKKQSIDDFYEIAEYAKKKGIFFCLEPLSKKETDFITSLEEGGEIVETVNHSNFKLHLDTKVLFDSMDKIEPKIERYKNIITHVHVGDENLLEPGIVNKKEHPEIGKSLRDINYEGYITLEMRRNTADIKGSIKRGVEFIRKNYLEI